MAEEVLSELVLNLISWLESSHEKNLKYEAQVIAQSKEIATQSKEIAKKEALIKELQARTAYQNGSILDPAIATTVIDTIGDQQQQQQQLQHRHQQQQAQHPESQSQNLLQLQPQQSCVQQIQQIQQPLHHNHQHPQPHHSQVVYQPMVASQSLMNQPHHQCIWPHYDPTTSGVMNAGQTSYWPEQYTNSAQAFAQHQQ